jgi:HD-like signal output (HDOD) protein
MGLVNIDCVEPGMVLASDLSTPEGRFLLPEGLVLGEKAIKACKAWGVRQANVVGQDQQRLHEAKMAAIDPELLEKSRLVLQPLLRKADMNLPAMAEIARIAEERIAGQLADGVVFPQDDKQLKPSIDIPDPPIAPEEGARAALRLIQGETTLISLPATFFKIMEVMESPFSSAFHIAEVVGKDSSLTAKLLKLVNSAFYGFPSKVDSISRAVALVGTKELTSLALGISVVEAFDGIPLKILDMKGFWHHSISCGVFASLVSSNDKGGGDERFFVAGLLHDLGRLLMIKKSPELCLEAMAVSRDEGIPLFQAEQRFFGYDHARIGGILCKKWRIPAILEHMVRYHHEPGNSKHFQVASTIHLANTLALAAGSGTSGEGVFPPVFETAWESLNLQVADLAPMVQQAQQQIEEIFHIFFNEEQAT